MKALTAADGLAEAEAGSYYAIVGAGGSLSDWTGQYEAFLVDVGVGKPQEWFTSVGEEVNEYARITKGGAIHSDDRFLPGLVFLMFPLDGLDVGRLAVLRLSLGDKWFDDILANMRVVHG